MLKKFLVGGWLAIGLIFLMDALAAEMPQERMDKMKSQTVLVVCSHQDAQGNLVDEGHGSGFVIGASDHVATNLHVVITHNPKLDICPFIKVFTPSTMLMAKLQYTPYTKDIAILELLENKKLDIEPVEFNIYAKSYDDVSTSGFPGAVRDVMGRSGNITLDDVKPSVNSGVISSIEERDNVKIYQTNASINSGNSGGPLFNHYGQVIGINTLKPKDRVVVFKLDQKTQKLVPIEKEIIEGDGIGFAIDIKELLPILDQLKIPYLAHNGPPSRIEKLQYLWEENPEQLFMGLALLLLAALVVFLAYRGRRTLQVISQLRRNIGEKSRSVIARISTRAPSSGNAPSSPAGRPMLKVVSGPYAGTEISLEKRPIAIGRRTECNLVIPDQYTQISGRHATVEAVKKSGGHIAFVLRDDDSANGTFTEKSAQKLAPRSATPLRDGERFYLANREFMYQVFLKS